MDGPREFVQAREEFPGRAVFGCGDVVVVREGREPQGGWSR